MTFKKTFEEDRIKYIDAGKLKWLKKIIAREHEYYIYKFVKLLRKEEYHKNNKNVIRQMWYLYLKNKIGSRLGFTIPAGVFGSGLKIWHYGTIVVNGYAKVGENCNLHGNNCIGNDGMSLGAPKIGKNVDIGFGAIIIGDVEIADNITVGAGAVVVSSFLEEHAIIAGIPAKKIN